MNEYMYVRINVCMNGLKGYITISKIPKKFINHLTQFFWSGYLATIVLRAYV